MRTELTWLNTHNGADKVSEMYIRRMLREYKDDLYGVIMGVAYGGDVEAVAKIWKDSGHVWGYDTFESLHPKHLAVNMKDDEATCMDFWYETMGTEKLSLEYQRGVLHKLNLNNAHLVKGEVTVQSCEKLPVIHYAFLDMDMIKSTQIGWKAIKDKIIKGGFVLFHDALPEKHLGGRIYKYIQKEIRDQDGFREYARYEHCHTLVIQKKP